MSIRFRLLISFMTTLAVTVLVFFLTAYLIAFAVTGDARSISRFYNIHYTLHPLTEEEERIFMEMKYLAKENPEQLMNKALLGDYDYQLKMVQAGLIVRHNQDLLFVSPSIREPGIGAALPDYEMGNYSIRNSINVGSRFFSYAKFDFPFSEQDRGSIFVIRERSPFAEIVRTLLPILIVVLLAILLLTSGLLYRYVTRTIVRPIHMLRESAERIKEGDLQFEFKPESDDEIGQLGLTFEKMRQKLNESIQLQLQYEENRKQLLSNISHDLRTPITTIRGYVEGIRDGVADSKEKMDKYIHTIYTKTADLDRLVDELFLYSKLDLNREPFSFETVDFLAFVRDMVEETELELEEKGIKIVWEGVRDAKVLVMADREKLKRVFLNLLGNCVKYMDKPEKRIVIITSVQENQVTVEVRDNGPGIPPEALPHIFERFYRGEPSRNAKTGGSGLGLAIAKQMVAGHGGRIWAESEWGEGTRMFFSLKIMGKSGDE
ncbi:HAMP domain-containing sensor histidine kinase [Paenibacillus sp. GD4]|jgi:signal transduction histidine kinase|uniref:sensor histidine kinase n=1 Tax=Paenibacillus sp. GD4 TaxID=3068890 RepID=UPI002796C5C2|nr:HAMP domain-containing sensor histidine kinase [Paenibacillus sp. GD4]MDQ1914496.1 HAMP domain-containing sensor histidine kinase [Paenibacillus sp. GD4]